MKKKLIVKNVNINFYTGSNKEEEYISLTDIARYKNRNVPKDVVKNWIRSKNTIEFLGLWERINNKNFKWVEFDPIVNAAGSNSFVLSPKKWILKTSAIGIISKSGRYGGTFAHKDIAFEFASWISSEFKLYLIKEFQRLKEIDQDKKSDWNVKRLLTKINYKIHTDAIKQFIIPKILSKKQKNITYATEADVINVALLGMTAKQWKNKREKTNIRDNLNINQLVCLSNLESLNAEFIRQGLSQSKRINILNESAIFQMKSLINSSNIIKLDI